MSNDDAPRPTATASPQEPPSQPATPGKPTLTDLFTGGGWRRPLTALPSLGGPLGRWTAVGRSRAGAWRSRVTRSTARR